METESKMEKRARRTPTERQIAALEALDTEALTRRAIEALHALNRRVKTIRDHGNNYKNASFSRALATSIDDIYQLKDDLLDVLVRTERATLHFFEVETVDDYPAQQCVECGRIWFGGNYCRACDAYTGDVDEPVTETETWYVVDCGAGFRFHQPEVAEDLELRATEIDSHDPEQPAREIPAIGLTIAAQRQCVEMAISRLRASLN